MQGEGYTWQAVRPGRPTYIRLTAIRTHVQRRQAPLQVSILPPRSFSCLPLSPLTSACSRVWAACCGLRSPGTRPARRAPR